MCLPAAKLPEELGIASYLHWFKEYLGLVSLRYIARSQLQSQGISMLLWARPALP